MAPRPGTATKLGLIRLFFSKRTPTWAKIFFGLLALAYFISPIDLVWDYPLFGIGWLDDAAVAAILMWVATKFGWGDGDTDDDAANEQPRRKPVENEAKRRRDRDRVGERSDGMRRDI